MLLRIIIVPLGGVLAPHRNSNYQNEGIEHFKSYMESILPVEAEFKFVYNGYYWLEEPKVFIHKTHYVYEISERNLLLRKMTNQTFLQFLNYELHDPFMEPPEIFIQEVEI